MEKKSMFGLDLNIDQDYLESAVKECVMMGISEALNGKNEIVSQLVHEVLSQKVNGNGQPTSSTYNSTTLLEYYTKNALKECIKEELADVINSKKDDIKRIFRNQINEDCNIEGMCGEFIKSLLRENNFRPIISVEFKKEDNY